MSTPTKNGADAAVEVEAKAAHVIEALSRVMRDLPAIGKDQTASSQQGGYAYRGIEQITQAAQPLFAAHGIVFVPRVVHHEIRELTVNNKPWTDTIELVEYDVYGPGGVDDRITVGPILAIGRDNSDKGANKCLTQAFKYALVQALCISDAKDDADGTTHEADAITEPDPYVSAANADALRTKCEQLGLDVAEVVRLGTGGRTSDPAEVLKTEVGAVKEAMDNLTPAPDQEPVVDA